MQHCTGPVLHWLAGWVGAVGVATARRGRSRAVKAATRENMLVELKGVELLE